MYILRAITFSVWINIIAAGWEYKTGRVIIQEKYLYAYRQYIAGFIGNFNDFCIFLLFGIMLFLMQLYLTKNKLEKIYCILGIVFSILIIFFDGARGGIYGLFCFVVFFPIFFLVNSNVFSKRTTNIIMILLGIVTVIVLVYYINNNGVLRSLAMLDNSNGGDIRSDRFRLEMIIKCLKATINSFGMGIGAGQSILVCDGINVHNFYIEIICEYGVLFALFVVYLTFIIPIERVKSIPPFLNAITQSFACCFIIANVTSSSVNKMRMLWMLLLMFYILKNHPKTALDFVNQ